MNKKNNFEDKMNQLHKDQVSMAKGGILIGLVLLLLVFLYVLIFGL